MYQYGQGVVQDYKQAVAWYKKAAAQGYAPAQFNLGVMYGKGQGVARDYVEALKWLILAGAGGLEETRKARGIVEQRMTHEQIADAQRRANEWLKVNRK